MKVSVLTVTYGDRFKYLKQVIDTCLKESGIYEFIVIDNASLNKEKIEEELLKYPDKKIKYIRLEKNTGSAGGYSKGIEYFYKSEANFLIMFDDDNKPEDNFLEKYKEEYQNISKQKGKITLTGYRKNLLASENELREYKEFSRNSFFGFDIFDKNILKKIYKNFINKNYKEKKVWLDFYQTNYFAYGSTMVSKEMVEKIGFPNKNFFIYSDDLDFSMRAKKIGYSFYISPYLIIEDLHLTYNDHYPHFFFANNTKNYQIFLSIRNSIIATKMNNSHNRFLFILNIIFYFFGILVLVSLRRKFLFKKTDLERFNLILRAIKSGFEMDFTIPDFIGLPK